jgi:hypothetical protein
MELTPKLQLSIFLVIILQHGISDGFSLLKQINQHIYRDSPDKVIQLKEGPGPSLLLQGLTLGYYAVMMPYSFFRQGIDIDSNAWFRPGRKLSRECHVGMTQPIPVQKIKEVYKEHGVSFGSVLYAALAGSINKVYKKQHGEVPEVVRCFTPFPWKNHPNDKLINHW